MNNDDTREGALDKMDGANGMEGHGSEYGREYEFGQPTNIMSA